MLKCFKAALSVIISLAAIDGCVPADNSIAPQSSSLRTRHAPLIRPALDKDMLSSLPGRQVPADARFDNAGIAIPIFGQGLEAAEILRAQSLIVYSGGSVSFWKMSGPAWSGYSYNPIALQSEWRVGAVADLNGDGHPDLLWERADNGLRAVTYMNGPVYGGTYSLLFVIPPEWRTVGAADFDNDGMADLVLANETTKDYGVLYLNGSTWTGVFAPLPEVSSAHRLAAVGDLNGDNKPDLIWQDETTGQPSITLLDGTASLGTVTPDGLSLPSPSWRIMLVADLDGNGNDLLLSDSITGELRIWHLDGFTRVGESFLPAQPPAWHFVAAARIQWGVIPFYASETVIAQTEVPTSGTTVPLFGLTPTTTCTPQPSCGAAYQSLAARFVLTASTRLELIEIWMKGGSGSMFLKIRADSAGLPGQVIASKGYFMGNYQSPIWVPFPMRIPSAPSSPRLEPGTYWVTFEPTDYSGMSALLPSLPPPLLSGYLAANSAVTQWHSLPGSEFGVRITGNQ